MDPSGLEKVLRAYEIPYDAAALRGVFEDVEQGRVLTEWARGRLTADTLLTRDHFTAIEKNGAAERLSQQTPDVALVPPLDDGELRQAIDDLNRSTEAISKQTETLRLQQDALVRLVKSTGSGAEARSTLVLKQRAKWEANRKSWRSEVDDLSQRLSSRLADLEQLGQGRGAGLHQTVDSTLQSDDRLLTSLQKLGRELRTDDPQEREDVGKLREVCARLIKSTVETIRTRLDRLYLETLETVQRSGSRDPVSSDDVTILQEELESLYSEILPVAQMTVEQQHLEPALKSLTAKDGQSLRRSAEAIDYIHDCLEYLMDHIRALSSCIETYQAHQAATSTLVSTAKSELATAIEAVPKRPRARTATSSPTRRRKSSELGGAVSPVRQRVNGGARRRSSGGADPEPPLEQLLRNLALSLPDDNEVPSGAASVNDKGRRNISFLSGTLDERRQKADDVARNVQESFEASAGAQLADAGRALRLIRDSVLAESPFGDINLVDPEMDGSIAVLAQEVQNARKRLDAAEKDIVSLRGRNVKKEEIISRWGS